MHKKYIKKVCTDAMLVVSSLYGVCMYQYNMCMCVYTCAMYIYIYIYIYIIQMCTFPLAPVQYLQPKMKINKVCTDAMLVVSSLYGVCMYQYKICVM